MRAGLAGLISPHPLGDTLPAVYLADHFVQQLCGGLDEVLAPVLATLDSWDAHLDPATAPEDSLGWLAGWLGLSLDENQSTQRRRDLVATGVRLLSRRGTVDGLREALDAYLDVDSQGMAVEISDPGGISWSDEPGAPLPGSAGGELLVAIRVADPQALDIRRVDAVVRAFLPAAVRHRIELLPPG